MKKQLRNPSLFVLKKQQAETTLVCFCLLYKRVVFSLFYSLINSVA